MAKSWTSLRSWLASLSPGTKRASLISLMKLSRMLKRAMSTTMLQIINLLVLKAAILTSSISGETSCMRMSRLRRAIITRCRMSSPIARATPTLTLLSAISLRPRPRSCLEAPVMKTRSFLSSKTRKTTLMIMKAWPCLRLSVSDLTCCQTGAHKSRELCRQLLNVVRVSPAMLGQVARTVVVSSKRLKIFNLQVGSKALRNSPSQSKKKEKMNSIFSEGSRWTEGKFFKDQL